MKLSAKTEYGCLAMLHLAQQHGHGEPVQIRKVAAEHDIPWRFLVQILLELKRAGLVISTRGAAGGYRLANAPAEISLCDVITALEGDLCQTPAGDPSPRNLRQVLHAACNDALQAQHDRLADRSLADLLECAKGTREPMWYI